jgi:1-deoxy-D-xylulose-5-phosphate reductoisomerase
VSKPPRDICRIIVLGSTGSIGTQSLQVIRHLNELHEMGRWPTRYVIVGLAAGRCSRLLVEQAEEHGARGVAHELDGNSAAAPCDVTIGSIEGCRGFGGENASLRLVEALDSDLVISAIAGSAGLPATLRAVELGRDVALANKETLVAAGSLITAAAKKSGARLLPIDSEHSGLWQALTSDQAPPMQLGPEVTRIILTASGGPFRTWTSEQLAAATPEQALQHPTWRMGPKVTIDSASLMNKALELIEAHWLFGLAAEQLEVLIHPQSIVHALVEYADGSVIAQLGAPDMRTPIQYALSHPWRASGIAAKLNLAELRRLEFETPDLDRFPALPLARRVIQEGGAAGAVFTAANEAAVEVFLDSRPGSPPRITFPQIAQLSAAALDAFGSQPLRSLEECLEASRWARQFVRRRLGL